MFKTVSWSSDGRDNPLPSTNFWNFSYSRRAGSACSRSEEHTSELQSQSNLVCRLLLEKKKKKSTKRQRYRALNTNENSTRVRHIDVGESVRDQSRQLSADSAQKRRWRDVDRVVTIVRSE